VKDVVKKAIGEEAGGVNLLALKKASYLPCCQSNLFTPTHANTFFKLSLGRGLRRILLRPAGRKLRKTSLVK
jgi:hypothetical protein